ncbi:MAG: phytanoyl-CoA dioxygenase family protein [Gammaproteobacteria bacterium]|nr:phytanoyl-CoA dioxygenase family protein [Gammaproteobacteria bacterium]
MTTRSPADPDRYALPSARYRRDGYVVLREFASAEQCNLLADLARRDLEPLVGPAEFEADVGYPGAPRSRNDAGGTTPRRLLHAYSRDAAFRQFATRSDLGAVLRQLLGNEPCLSQCHHNCVMTKHPGYSSATLWHQDVRYWSFDRPDLVSLWLALGTETAANGALMVIPGSHRLNLDRGRLDRDLFLRPDLPENNALIEQAMTLKLAVGDVLLFSSRLFHAAGRNDTDAVKLSLVFTYHAPDNRPIPGTRSAQYPSIRL